MSIVRRRSLKLADRRDEIAIVAPSAPVPSRQSRKSHADRVSADDQGAGQRGSCGGQGTLGGHAQRADQHDRHGAGSDSDADPPRIPLHYTACRTSGAADSFFPSNQDTEPRTRITEHPLETLQGAKARKGICVPPDRLIL